MGWLKKPSHITYSALNSPNLSKYLNRRTDTAPKKEARPQAIWQFQPAVIEKIAMSGIH
jgi:hypothetical protein